MKDLDLSNNLFIMDELQVFAEAFKASNIELLNLRGNVVSAEEILAFDATLATVANMPKRKFLFWKITLNKTLILTLKFTLLKY